MVESGQRTVVRATQEARLRVLGHPGPASSASAEPSIRFAFQPSTQSWYVAHNVSIVTAYLDHRDLAEQETRVERFFINLVLIRLLFATRSSPNRASPSPGSHRPPMAR